MPRVVDAGQQLETWKNTSRGKVVLKRVDRLGNLIDEVVSGGRSIHLTSEERKINQELCASDDLDMFKNGLLTPVRLIETAEDIQELRGNPNHLSDSEIKGLYKLKTIKTFTAKIDGITNPVVLERLAAAANDDDVDATVKQVEAVQARLTEVQPKVYGEVSVVENSEMPGRVVATKAPGL